MALWDTVMIALVIGSTIAFCFWARIRCAGNDGKASRFIAAAAADKLFTKPWH